MKAIVVTRYGKTEEVVELRDMPAPVVGPRDVLIEVHAASVNPIDFKMQQGELKAVRKLQFPYIMGFDVSGVVKAVGSEVYGFQPGEAVYSRVDGERFGTFAELVAVDEQFVAHKPARLSHAEAASLPLVALTSWQAFGRASLKAGQRVLVHAGAGGIGTIAIQIARALGAKVATTTSARNVELVRSLGADTVVDYQQQQFDTVLSNYDMVLETLGGDNQRRSFSVLKPGGILVSILGVPTAAWARQQKLPFFMPWLFGWLNRGNDKLARQHKVQWDMLLMQPDGQQLRGISDLVEAGLVTPVIDRVFPLAQAKQALLHSQSGRARGKIVIEVKAAAA